jgi:hypothetical protein
MVITVLCSLASLRRVSVTVGALLVVVLVTLSHGYHHEVLFPPNDEYGLFEFHPPTTTTMDVVGFPPLWSVAPYGGYSRACASRLSKLPLKLIGDGAQFEEQQNYFNIRDGQGRLFACKVYQQDELEKKSLYDSLFDDAIVLMTKNNNNDNTAYEDIDVYNSEQQQQQQQQPESSSIAKDGFFSQLDSSDGTTVVPAADNNDQQHHQVTPKGTNKAPPTGVVEGRRNSDNLLEIVDRELLGACTQFHTG